MSFTKAVKWVIKHDYQIFQGLAVGGLVVVSISICLYILAYVGYRVYLAIEYLQAIPNFDLWVFLDNPSTITSPYGQELVGTLLAVGFAVVVVAIFVTIYLLYKAHAALHAWADKE